MLRHRSLLVCLTGLACSCASLTGFVCAGTKEADPPTVRIGMVKTLFTDIPQPLVQILLHPFGAMMKHFTGVNGSVVLTAEPLETARALDEGKIDIGVFHGVEYAWAKERHPKLRPLMVAVTKYRHAQAHLVVRKDCEAKCWADLKTRKLAYPLRSREHSRLFLHRNCLEAGQCEPQQFFGKVVASASMEQALDDVCSGTVCATIVDTVALDAYENLKPGCFGRLRVLQDSELFPTGAIVYREGNLDQDLLDRFRNGLVGAAKTEQGRDFMSMFRITSFEPIPDDYFTNLADIIRVYPAPEPATHKVSTTMP